MKQRTKYVLLAFLLVALMFLVGCQSYLGEGGESQIGISEEAVATGDTIVEKVEEIIPVAREVLDLTPEPIRSTGRVALEIIGGLIGLWGIIRSARLTMGSRIVAKVLKKTVKDTDAWATIGPALAEAVDEHILMKPIMPDKA